jgi:hypothetical protein
MSHHHQRLPIFDVTLYPILPICLYRQASKFSPKKIINNQLKLSFAMPENAVFDQY